MKIFLFNALPVIHELDLLKPSVGDTGDQGLRSRVEGVVQEFPKYGSRSFYDFPCGNTLCHQGVEQFDSHKKTLA